MNTKEKKALDKRLRAYWEYVKFHSIRHNVRPEAYAVVCEFLRIFHDKEKPPPYPDESMVCPVAVFNNRSISIGGRFYRAFWINMPRPLRRLITIDGELTADIDGCAMHVQLLYQKAGLPMPEDEPYIYPKGDERRKVTKRLMLYMMNTRKDWGPVKGRQAVIRTYRKHHGDEPTDEYIHELERTHAGIKHLLYQNNWGILQGTEAGVMLKIMEAAKAERILVLPIHDGCLCRRSHKNRVLELFEEQGIMAAENEEHLEPLKMKEMHMAIEDYKKAKMAVKL